MPVAWESAGHVNTMRSVLCSESNRVLPLINNPSCQTSLSTWSRSTCTPPSTLPLPHTHSGFDLSPVDIFYFLFPSSPGSDLEVRRGNAGSSQAKWLPLTSTALLTICLSAAEICFKHVFLLFLNVSFPIKNATIVQQMLSPTHNPQAAHLWPQMFSFSINGFKETIIRCVTNHAAGNISQCFSKEGGKIRALICD